MAVLLYTALTDLKIYSVIATWPCSAGSTVPLDPTKASTIALLAAGSIELAPEGAADTCTPPHVLRGQPGIRVGISN